jgi:type I restriction enzyme, S subunit
MKPGWKTVRLGEVCRLDKQSFRGDDLPYVGMEDIDGEGSGVFLGNRKPKSVQSNTFRFRPGHVLYGRLRPYLNKSFIPDFEGHCSTEIFPILPSEKISDKYLFYWITSAEICEKINGTCTGARMPRANFKEVLAFPLPLPPLPEQRAIVAKLDALRDKTRALEGVYTQKLDALAALRHSVLHHAFRGEL